MLHHHQGAGHHRRGEGGSAGVVDSPDTRFIGVGMRAEIGGPDLLAGRGYAPLGGAAAAVGKGSDLAVLADRDHGDDMALQFGNQHGQARQDLDRFGIDAIFCIAVFDVGFAQVRVAREVGRIAGIAVRVARGPDEDGLLGRAGLGEGVDGVAVIAAEILRGVLVDDSRVAYAQIHEVDGSAAVAPVERLLEHPRPESVIPVEARQLYREIVAATRPGRDREHRDIGAPRHSRRTDQPPDDHARDRRAVGWPVQRSGDGSRFRSRRRCRPPPIPVRYGLAV